MNALALRLPSGTLALHGNLVMGIVNASSNSFSDAGQYRSTADRIELAGRLIEEGATIIDVGGQSLVGDEPEEASTEIALVEPIITWIASEHPAVHISIDTYKPEVAKAAVAAGATIVNDVSGLRYPEIAEICAATGAALVISHMLRRPNQKFISPDHHRDVGSDVGTFLATRIDLAVSLGVPFESVILDPGPDLAKTPAQTIEVLRHLDQVRKLGRPLLLALSRKDFIGAITLRTPRNRDAGTMAAVALTAQLPGNIFRVHDVRSTVDVIKVVDVLSGRIDIPAGFELPDEIRIEAHAPLAVTVNGRSVLPLAPAVGGAFDD